MPPAIAAFAAWAGMTITAAYLTVAAVVISVGTAVYGAAQARKAERAARNSLNEGMKDRMVTRIATEAPHRYVYGRAKVGSDVVAMFTSGERDEFRHLVCVHAAHECDAIEEIWVNNALVDSIDSAGDPAAGRFAVDPNSEIAEELVTGPTFTLQHTPRLGSVWVFKGIGSNMLQVEVVSVNGRAVTVAESGQLLVSYERSVRRKMTDLWNEAANPSPKNPVVRVQKHLGGANDAADVYLRSIVGDKWPATAVLRGMCYSVITLDLTHPEFQGGLVPIHAVIRGRKLYDPRTGEKAWSANPALAIMDYLTSPLCGVPMEDLPLSQFITAANACDEVGNVPGARYTLNGTVTSDQSQSTVLEAMTQAMAGGLVATTWDIYAGKYVAPVAALTQEDIVGGLSVNPGVSDASVYNGVKGQYISPENNHVQTDFAPYQNPTYREADGRDLYTNLDFPFTDSLQRVTNLARIFTEDQRNGFTIKAEFSLKAWPLKVGQRITFTSAFLGQNAKVYRITDKSYSPSSAVNLTLKEDAESIWDFADAVVVDSTPNSDLPDPWKLDQLASIACTSGEATLLRQADGSIMPRILASWPATAHANGLQVDVEWRAVSSSTWERTSVSAGETKAYLSPITPGFFYVVRARVSNPSLNVQSNWVSTVYQVAVLTARPVVYKWAATKPAAPSGAATYLWSNGTFGAAPAGWSLTEPAPPPEGDASLWAAGVLVSDIDASGSAPFNWSSATVAAVGYSYDISALDEAIANIVSDNVLDKGEKGAENEKFDKIYYERAGLVERANALGVSSADYTAKYNALQSYLTSLGTFADFSVDTQIVGSTYRSHFINYATAKQALQNVMTEKAATLSTWTGTSGRPPDSDIRNNLVDLKDWRQFARPNWPINSEGNAIFPCAPGAGTVDLPGDIPGPRGGNDLVWYCQEQANNGGEGGGWDNAPVSIDPTKTYRFVIPIRRRSGSGTAYWGINEGTLENLNGALNPNDGGAYAGQATARNPYFADMAGLSTDRWYLFIGFIYPAGSTNNTHDNAGVWDCKTGQKVDSGLNFRFKTGVSLVEHRAYQYYASNQAEQLFGRPMVNVVDGTEPSIREYFEAGAVMNTAISITPSGQLQGAGGGKVTFPGMGLNTYRVVAYGAQAGSKVPTTPGLWINGAHQYNPWRGYRLFVIRRSDLAMHFTQTYDTYGNGALTDGRNADTMAADLNWFATNGAGQYVMVVLSHDEPASNRSAALMSAMYRNGASRAIFGSPNFKIGCAYVLIGLAGCGEGSGAEFYQGAVNSDPEAWVDVMFTMMNGEIASVSPQFTPKTLQDYGFLGAMDATSDLSLVGRGVTVAGNVLTKTGGLHGFWDVDAYSRDAYSGGAFAAARALQTNMQIMFGLNTDAATDGSGYSTLDYAMYLGGDGNLYGYVSGSIILGGAHMGPYTTNDVLAVVYDGSTVRWMRNGAILHSVTVTITLPLFFDSSFNGLGAGLANVRFGPMSSNAWASIGGVGKPADNATVGAPAGTNVAGVPAEQVAAGANAINAAFSATLTGSASGGSYPNGSYGYGYLQVNITGGNAPYSARWILTAVDSSGNAGGMTMTSRTGTYNEFNGSGSNCSMDYDVTVIVTDAKQRSLTLGTGISVTHGTPV